MRGWQMVLIVGVLIIAQTVIAFYGARSEGFREKTGETTRNWKLLLLFDLLALVLTLIAGFYLSR